MRNAVVAYISYARFRKLPLFRALLGESFTPAQLPTERRFVDEATAAAVAAELQSIGLHDEHDDVLITTEEPLELRLERAARRAATHPRWMEAARTMVNFPGWRVTVAPSRRCVAIGVDSPGAPIGSSMGFLVDRETERVFFRPYWRIATFVRENAVVEWSVGQVASGAIGA